VLQIFEAWRARQRVPRLCKLTAERTALISKRLKLGYTVDDILALIRYAWEADAPGPRWWRGENPNGTKYLDLNNLLVELKLAPRVQAALEWLEQIQAPAPEPAQMLSQEEAELLFGGPSNHAKLRTRKSSAPKSRSIKRD
jgi:hypothetical protein